MIAPRTVAAVASVVLALVRGASAPALDLSDAAPDSPYLERGDLELRTIERALAELDLEPEHEPWGRTVCAVHQRTYPIVFEEDLLPTWINMFHRRTIDRVVARANTIEVGDTFDSRAYEDAERAIRDPLVFSVVAVVPARSAEPDCVDVVVVTRDVWTLKPSWSLESNGATLTTLFFGVTDHNLFGTTDALSLGFTRSLGSWSMGPTYYSRHFAGSRLVVFETFDVIVDREVGGLEGTANTFQIGRPLYDTHVRWAWSATAWHEFALRRRYVGSTLSLWDVDGEVVPERYRVRSAGASGSVTRSWGEAYKTNLSPGFAVSWADYEPVPRDPTLSPEALATFEAERLPRSELAVGPTIHLEWYKNSYFRLVDYATYAVSEELSQGPVAGLGLRLSEPSFGSDERFATITTNMSWRLALGDDAFFGAAFAHSVRADGGLGDVSVSGSARLVTPRAFAGRFVARIIATELKRNGGNSVLTLGGDNGLRGYPNAWLQGTRSMLLNIEWRSKPLRIGRARFGGVVSYDVGSAWDRNDPVFYYPSAGVGLRLMAPSMGTTVRAADLSFPLRPFGRPLLSLGLEQAF